ncbi:MAG: DUF262 domain-containing protein [Magnetococcales bacterium]|nr:DUF262 domain-containing protein [Magnetococcales bacterium]
MNTIEDAINKKIGEVRIDTLDISFGEVISLHSQNELIIQPEYQRLFRWSNDQKSRLIESILLQLPIPQVFVIENETGVYELIDGLQRISSVINFIDYEQISTLEEPLSLSGCDIIPELNNQTFNNLSLTLKLRIKRSTVRMVVIKKQSNSMLKYEMFKRLNTGGSLLSAQEVRNCSVRMFGPDGITFYEFLIKCANNQDYKTCTSSIYHGDKEQKLDEELVLRFFAAKNNPDMFREKRKIKDWLDSYLETILTKKTSFNYNKEYEDFEKVFMHLSKILGEYAFVRHRNNIPIGSLAPAYFEAIAIGTFKSLPILEEKYDKIRDAIVNATTGPDFKESIGPGSNKMSSLTRRIELIAEAIQNV